MSYEISSEILEEAEKDLRGLHNLIKKEKNVITRRNKPDD